MTARDDYPYRERNVPIYANDRTLHEEMCDEIDRLRLTDEIWLGELVQIMSVHLDLKIQAGADHLMSARELGWERIGKIAEEYGEVTEAWIGVAGSNPRKGKTHTDTHLLTELLDVALCALGAYEHVTGNAGNCHDALYEHAVSRTDRMGLGAEFDPPPTAP